MGAPSLGVGLKGYSKNKCVSGKNTCECFKNKDCDAKEDGNGCNGTLFCNLANNKCTIDSNTIVVCDKSKDSPCRKFHCDKNKGECVGVSLKNGTPCDADGSVCTNGDACTAGICKTGKSTACDDANPCTDDFCHPKDGCSKKNNLAPCRSKRDCQGGSECACANDCDFHALAPFLPPPIKEGLV